MVGLYYVIQEMSIFPMSVANNFCDMPLPKYLDLKTVLIYRPHPVYGERVFCKMSAYISSCFSYFYAFFVCEILNLAVAVREGLNSFT
jgi:hypothetical protein